MMHRIFIIVSLFFVLQLHGQALRDINYSYLYNPSEEFMLNWKIVHHGNQIAVYFQLEPTTAGNSLDNYSIQWKMRKELSDKEDQPLLFAESSTFSDDKKSGKLVIDTTMAGKIVVANVVKKEANKSTLTLIYKVVPNEVAKTLWRNDAPIMKSYTQINTPVSIKGFRNDKQLLVSRYTEDFPAAGPPFATAQARVKPTLKPDTIFNTSGDTPIQFSGKGLYLIQSDTTSNIGLAFRIEDDYPKLGKLESLVGPMIYVSTKLEYDKLKDAGNDKPQFDKVILSITGNTDRAKIFMRNYFRRVEHANVYFSSFKEGWKTDRGMIYIICGLPQAVYLLGDREVWEYKNTYYSGRFTFVKSATLFDPDNYVLIRDKKFTNDWYQMIDLWRKARF